MLAPLADSCYYEPIPFSPLNFVIAMLVKNPVESILALAASVFDAYSVVLFESPRNGQGAPIMAAYSQGDHINQNAVIQPGKAALIPTGLFLELPLGYEAQVRPRSGLALKHCITVLNSPGTIDAGYRGEVASILFNAGEIPFEIHRGDRISQMVIAKLADITLERAETLSETTRSEGGFGSTGRT